MVALTDKELFPYYHLVPKDPAGHAAYRRTVLEAAYQDDDCKEELWIRCSRDELYFINTILFTYDPRKTTPAVPFNTYKFQDRAVRQMKLSWGQDDMLIEKSRDMGASWLSLAYIFSKWNFDELISVLIGSRKQEYVDKRGDKKALFAKFDFMLEHMPRWMVPSHTRNQLHLRNDLNGATIDGESTNSDFGRGDRRTIVFLDEFASVETGYAVESATRDVTKCRWYNSTPKGVGNAFYEKREKMTKLRPDNILRMHWSEHPEKAEGLYTSTRMEDDEHYQLEIVDTEYDFPETYPFILDGKTRSPWYDEQCFRAANQQEIAQELDIDYKKSGWLFFENVDAIIARDQAEPFVTGELIYNIERPYEKPQFMPQEGGRLKLWIRLDVNNDFLRSEEFTVGCDVATGSGGDHSSNSVASVVGRVSGRKVAEFATNHMSPEEYADYAIAICRFFHGVKKEITAHLIWEGNGPGVQFGKRVKKRNYGRIFYRRNEIADEKSSSQPGWWSDRKTKKILLGEYGSALKTGNFKNPSLLALQELNEYIHEPTGDIVHSRAKALKDVDPTSSGENHGDRVIADALAWHGRAYIIDHEPKAEEREAPPGSMAHRMEQRRKREQYSTSWQD